MAAAALAGCKPARPIEPDQAPDGSIRGTAYGKVLSDQFCTVYTKVSIEGHDYITARARECVAVVHAESCPCRAKK